MKNKLLKAYIITIITIAILNLISGIYFFVKNPITYLMVVISSLPELPLLVFSLIILIYCLCKKMKINYLVLPIVNLIVYTGLLLVGGYNLVLANIINALLYVFYIGFGYYLLKKHKQ